MQATVPRLFGKLIVRALNYFPRDNSVPPEWNSTDPVQTPAGEVSGERVLAMVTKGGIVGQQNQAFSGPLIDQNKKLRAV